MSPRSNRAKCEWADDALKIWVRSSPTDGQANAEAIETLADALGVGKRAVRIVSGATSRTKRIEVEGITLEEAHNRIP